VENRNKLLILIAALLAVLVLTPHSGSYIIVLVTHALIFAILAMSLDILLGFTGLPSLGQAA
jgi:branched-chain amino acid transport system permease protein